MSLEVGGRRGRTLVALLVIAGFVVVTAGTGCSPSNSRVPEKASVVASQTPGPFTMPEDQLVVPYDLIPKGADTAKGIEASIRRAFGPLLAKVSVEATKMAGVTDDSGIDQSAFRVEYWLVDCRTPAISYTMDLDNTGLVPPLTQLDDTPPGRDWMSATRFRELLRAWGKVRKEPFGALQSYASAVRWTFSVGQPLGATTVSVDGTKRVTKDLWVITPGAATQRAYEALRDQFNVPGYVFLFPEGGTPQYLGRNPEIGEGAPFGD